MSMPDPSRWSDGGFFLLRGLFSWAEQQELAREGERIAAVAPFVVPRMPDGTPFRCSVTAAGAGLFFSSRERGYHYTRLHPETLGVLPPIPGIARELGLRALAVAGVRPVDFDTMLLNRYREGDSLGLHVDVQEIDLDAALVSLCVGADGEFLVGGLERDFKPDKALVSGGDAIVMSGDSRLWYHGRRRVMQALVSPLPPGVGEAYLLRKAFR
jgi:alkylated DNA repair protein (DNA oxidative demethylase)